MVTREVFRYNALRCWYALKSSRKALRKYDYNVFQLCACLFDLDRHPIFKSGFELKASLFFRSKGFFEDYEEVIGDLSRVFILGFTESFHCAFVHVTLGGVLLSGNSMWREFIKPLNIMHICHNIEQ